jgi:cystathionine beta-lyase
VSGADDAGARDGTAHTRLVHPRKASQEGFAALPVPVHRASTVLFPTLEAYRRRAERYYDGYTYGLAGTPTSATLAQQVADLEGGYRSVLVPSGLAAITLVDLALLAPGDHVLLPDNVYDPSRDFADRVLARWGVATSYYDPLAGAGIAALMRPNTRLVWAESPGSLTMEVPDLPAICAAAHAAGARVALDNTWSAGLFCRAFELGADISVQALTKYQGGHSDVLMGSVTAADPELWRELRRFSSALGTGVSPEDASLVLRGMQSLAARMRVHEQSALSLARWLASRPEVERVLHPALPGCPGHEHWKRDFTGASGLFAFVLDERYDAAAVARMVDGLRWFGIGSSWGGAASLAIVADPSRVRTVKPWRERGALVRLSIGLEAPEDLMADLEAGLGRLAG